MKSDIFDRIKNAGFEQLAYYHIWKPVWIKIYYLVFRKFYGHLGKNVYVSPRASVLWKKNVHLGDGSIICSGAKINVVSFRSGNNFSLGFNSCILGSVVIGENVMIGTNVSIIGGNHGIKLSGIPMNRQDCSSVGITIMNDVWIGSNSVVLDKSIIRDHCVIAASSVVRQTVEAESISGGNPLKIIRYRK